MARNIWGNNDPNGLKSKTQQKLALINFCRIYISVYEKIKQVFKMMRYATGRSIDNFCVQIFGYEMFFQVSERMDIYIGTFDTIAVLLKQYQNPNIN